MGNSPRKAGISRMSPDRTAQSLHPVASPGHLSRKSLPDQPKDHRPTALPRAAREPRARAMTAPPTPSSGDAMTAADDEGVEDRRDRRSTASLLPGASGHAES